MYKRTNYNDERNDDHGRAHQREVEGRELVPYSDPKQTVRFDPNTDYYPSKNRGTKRLDRAEVANHTDMKVRTGMNSTHHTKALDHRHD